MYTSRQQESGLTQEVLDVLSKNYDGNDFENFAGNVAQSMRASKKSSQMFDFKFRLVNAGQSSLLVALTRGIYDVLGVASVLNQDDSISNTIHYHNTENIVNGGHAIDAVLDDGTIATSLTCTAARKKVRDFMHFISQNPVLISQIILDVDDKAAFAEDLTISRTSPFRNVGEDAILSLSDYVDPKNLNDKKIVIDLLKDNYNCQFDGQTLATLGVGAGRTIDVTLKIALIDNSAAKFNQMLNA